jgi:hypothetical protein
VTDGQWDACHDDTPENFMQNTHLWDLASVGLLLLVYETMDF